MSNDQNPVDMNHDILIGLQYRNRYNGLEYSLHKWVA